MYGKKCKLYSENAVESGTQLKTVYICSAIGDFKLFTNIWSELIKVADFFFRLGRLNWFLKIGILLNQYICGKVRQKYCIFRQIPFISSLSWVMYTANIFNVFFTVFPCLIYGFFCVLLKFQTYRDFPVLATFFLCFNYRVFPALTTSFFCFGYIISLFYEHFFPVLYTGFSLFLQNSMLLFF